MVIRGEFIDISEDELNNKQKIDRSFKFRKRCMDLGYHILHLYPIYYQGWDMDEWGVIGEKDNQIYCLETDHNMLLEIPIKSFSYEPMKVLIFE